jgi:hypothetical protein
MEAAHYQNSRSKLLFADSSKPREHSVPNHLIYLKSLLTPMATANWKIYLFLLLFFLLLYIMRQDIMPLPHWIGAQTHKLAGNLATSHTTEWDVRTGF